MPNKASAEKALRQDKKRSERNKTKLVQIRDLSRHFRKALETKDKAQAEKLIKDLIIALDKAAQRNILKRNTAARKKSRLMKRLNTLSK